MAATPGTLPFYPPYQPAALPLTGSEILYLVSSSNATAAASFRWAVTDIPKIAGVLPSATPSLTDQMTFLQSSSSGLPMSCSFASLSVIAGNVATGGVAGQLYFKNSATNFDASWTTAIPSLTLQTTTIGTATVTNLTVTSLTAANATVSATLSVNVLTAATLFVTTGTATGFAATNFTATNGTVLHLNVPQIATVGGLSISTNGTVAGNIVVAGSASLGTPLTIANGGIGTTALGTVAVLIGGASPTAGVATVNATSPGLVLTSNGSTTPPSWFGSMVLLNTLSPNAVASTTDTTSLTSTYRDYMIMLENVCPATNTATLQLAIATTGAAWVTGGYVAMANVVTNSVQALDTSTTAILLSGLRSTTSVATATTAGVSGAIFLQNPAGTILNKQFNGNLSYQGTNASGALGTTNYANVDFSGTYAATSAPIVGMAFAFSAGNIATGTIKIWGLV